MRCGAEGQMRPQREHCSPAATEARTKAFCPPHKYRSAMPANRRRNMDGQASGGACIRPLALHTEDQSATTSSEAPRAARTCCASRWRSISSPEAGAQSARSPSPSPGRSLQRGIFSSSISSAGSSATRAPSSDCGSPSSVCRSSSVAFVSADVVSSPGQGGVSPKGSVRERSSLRERGESTSAGTAPHVFGDPPGVGVAFMNGLSGGSSSCGANADGDSARSSPSSSARCSPPVRARSHASSRADRRSAQSAESSPSSPGASGITAPQLAPEAPSATGAAIDPPSGSARVRRPQQGPIYKATSTA
mmetsp:Transcript_84313/g.243730  ORF Transcript_84313/g.243730 Transcript_84313/m.243730 type:complete len:306 (-) Transcript_84313:34-951(-)